MNHLERIVVLYQKADIAFQKHLNEKSEHWKRYFNDTNKFSDMENIKNFRRSLSNGLDDSNPSFSFKVFMDVINELGENFVFNNLSTKNVGNCEHAYRLKGRFVDYNELIHIHWYKDLVENVFNKKDVQIVCEIGGGYGSLARIILNNHNCKFISIDLPEANLLTSYYLKESLPSNKRFYLYDDFLNEQDGYVSIESINNYDIFILPPWAKYDNGLKVDLFINTRSMMEMNVDVIKMYFDFIHKYISNDGFFLDNNRYIKYSKGDGYPIRFCDYPYDKNWDVIKSKKAYKQNHMHFLITQRKFEDFSCNIRDEIDNIKAETKKYADSLLEKETPLKKVIMETTRKTLIFVFGKRFLRMVGKKLID